MNQYLFPSLGRTAFGIEIDVQSNAGSANIYLQKLKEMSDNDLEYTRLAQIHRIAPNALFANLCACLFHLQQWTNWGIPTDVWFSEHIYQLVEPRFQKINSKQTPIDVLQLMIEAVHSDGKVSIIDSFKGTYRHIYQSWTMFV